MRCRQGVARGCSTDRAAGQHNLRCYIYAGGYRRREGQSVAARSVPGGQGRPELTVSRAAGQGLPRRRPVAGVVAGAREQRRTGHRQNHLGRGRAGRRGACKPIQLTRPLPKPVQDRRDRHPLMWACERARRMIRPCRKEGRPALVAAGNLVRSWRKPDAG